jgi:hypothetical protein
VRSSLLRIEKVAGGRVHNAFHVRDSPFQAPI